MSQSYIVFQPEHDKARDGQDALPGEASFDQQADDERCGERAQAEAEVEEVESSGPTGPEDVEEEPFAPPSSTPTPSPAGTEARRKTPQDETTASATRPAASSPAAKTSTGRRPTLSVTKPPPNDPAAYVRPKTR